MQTPVCERINKMAKRLNIKHKHSGINPNTCTLGPAKILHPLRYIAAKCRVETRNLKGETEIRYLEPMDFAIACALAGDGRHVNGIARALHNA